MRIPSTTSAPPTSWRAHKDSGGAHFSSGRYREALASYRAALSPEYGVPPAERQILLSNVVACRLKIVAASEPSPPGGDGAAAEAERRAMASAAVEEARQCVDLNDRWAKGHVRLASALLALGRDRSNDACNSLQRALALDPSNAVARQMLLRELRRDRDRGGGDGDGSGGAAGASGGGGGGGVEPSAPPFEEEEEAAGRAGGTAAARPAASADPAAPAAPPPDDYAGSPTADFGGDADADAPHGRPDDAFVVDESPSLTERAQFHLARLWAWWERGLSEDARTLLKVAAVLLALYVAFGGRFGMDAALGGAGGNRGRYEPGESAYDRYYGGGPSSSYSRPSGSHPTGYNDRSAGRYPAGRYSSGGDPYGRGTSPSSSSSSARDYAYAPRSSRRAASSHHIPNLFDGSVPSMIILAAFAYGCHRFGVNPFHALWMLNVFTGNRGRGMHRMGMMGGMGYGMMRNNMGWGGRRRGG